MNDDDNHCFNREYMNIPSGTPVGLRFMNISFGIDDDNTNKDSRRRIALTISLVELVSSAAAETLKGEWL